MQEIEEVKINQEGEYCFYIGYHKTGTTWLQKYLFNNPVFGFSSLLTWEEIFQLLVYPHLLDFEASEYGQHIHQALRNATDTSLMPVISMET